MLCQIRKRTEPKNIAYSLYLYFLGLSLRSTSKALSRFVKRSHTAFRDWIQKYKPEMLSSIKIRRFLNVEYHIHSSIEKSFIERIIQYIKDRTEGFVDDYYPCTRINCKLVHIMNWLGLFVDMH